MAAKAKKQNKPILKPINIQANTSRTVFVQWTWIKNTDTKEYTVTWQYGTGQNVWFDGSSSTVKPVGDNKAVQVNTYTAPDNALYVRVQVKATANTTKKTVSTGTKGKTKTTTVPKFTAVSSGWETLSFNTVKPEQADIPSVTVNEFNKFQLDITLANLDPLWTAQYVQFKVVIDDSPLADNKESNTIPITWVNGKGNVTWTYTMSPGHRYKVCCRGKRKAQSDDESDYGYWSDYTDNFYSPPEIPLQMPLLVAKSKTSLQIEWASVSNCTGYDIQYATKREYLENNSNEAQNVSTEGTGTTYILTGLESGQEYFVRVRAKNSAGESGWSYIASRILGKDPVAPTTWSSSTTGMVGEDILLYWVHNAQDGSSQTKAELELTIDGVVQPAITVPNNRGEDDKDKTSVYTLATNTYSEGVKIKWRVRTAGITDTYGEWSVSREINIYAKPTMILTLYDSQNTGINAIVELPFHVKAVTGPNTQAPIGYYVSITAKTSYVVSDYAGNDKNVSAGDEVYGKYFDITTVLDIPISAGDVNLEIGEEYTLSVTASLNSGLTVESSVSITVDWSDEGEYIPDASDLTYLPDEYAMLIHAYCTDDDDAPVDGVILSVYRIEPNGDLVEIGSNLANGTTVLDPHPSLNYASYRIVAINSTTGVVGYVDMFPYEIGEEAAIIQWNEKWPVSVEYDEHGDLTIYEELQYADTLVLPYNLDVSEKSSPDVSLVKYIGRKYPVSYYGTQLGDAQSWKLDIVRDDINTLNMLRRLKDYQGDVYVREPSGSGCWANITVSFSQTHCETTIPVTIEITRVEGGK